MNKNVGTAVFFEDKILLAKRIEFYKGDLVPFGGYWSIFCGAIEKNESAIVAAKRELYEETKIIPSRPLIFLDKRIDADSEFSFYYIAIDKMIEPELCFEHTESAWFKVEDLESFPYKIDSYIKNLILKSHSLI